LQQGVCRQCCKLKKNWQVINEVLSSTKPGSSTYNFANPSGELYNDLEAATKLNEYFVNLGTIIGNSAILSG